MNSMININSKVTMSSISFWESVIVPARTEAGEPMSTYQNFLAKVIDEIDDLGDEEKHISEKINNLGFSVKYKTPFYNLNMEQMTLVGMRESKAVRRSVLDKLKQLSGAKGAATYSPVSDALAIAEVAARMLNMSNSSKLGMLQKVERQYGVPSILPSYAVDAPSDAADGSSRVTVSLTELLKLNDVKLSAQAAYKSLQSAGIVERRTRPSTGGSEKEFWALTTNGLLYGKNITSPNNPRQVQPHFYETKTSAILAIISSK